MQYPIFLKVSEALVVLRIGRTSLYARIKDGSLKAAKVGRGTRITFSSVIEYALRCLREGNGTADHAEILDNANEVESWMMADHLVQRLCSTHCKPADSSAEEGYAADSRSGQRSISKSLSKNNGGEF